MEPLGGTARWNRERIGMVIKWATAEGHRHGNPAGPQIITALPRRPQNSEHHPALPFAEVGKAIKRIRDTNAWWSTKLCMEFVALTAVRSGEARLARWDEIDEEHLIWTIPASRMRRNLEHKVPLSNAAMTVLSQARDLKYPTVSGDLLDPGTCWIRGLAGSGDLLDPGTCWIRGLAGSGDLLERAGPSPATLCPSCCATTKLDVCPTVCAPVSSTGLPNARTRQKRLPDTPSIEAVREALIVVWEAADRICGKRLRAALPHLVGSKERLGHLGLDPQVRQRLLTASAATLDRLLQPIRTPVGRRLRRRRRAVALQSELPPALTDRGVDELSHGAGRRVQRQQLVRGGRQEPHPHPAHVPRRHPASSSPCVGPPCAPRHITVHPGISPAFKAGSIAVFLAHARGRTQLDRELHLPDVGGGLGAARGGRGACRPEGRPMNSRQ